MAKTCKTCIAKCTGAGKEGNAAPCSYHTEGPKQEETAKPKRNDKMKKTTPAMCSRCVHGGKFNTTTVMCNYLEDTGKRRGCPIGYCDKYERRRNDRLRTNKKYA